MLNNEERGLLHVATVLVRGGHIDQYRVSEDGIVTGPRTQFRLNASCDDDDVATILLIYTAANLIKLRHVDTVEALDHLVDLGARPRKAKNVVNRVVGRAHRKDFLLVWDFVRPLYGLSGAAPTADLGGCDGE